VNFKRLPTRIQGHSVLALLSVCISHLCCVFSLPFLFIYHTGDENKAISILLVGGPDAPPATKVWLALVPPSNLWPDFEFGYRILDIARHFTRPVKLTNGNHTFGSLTLAERRIIQPSFAEMMGVSAPVRGI
jgi:hypothetical protein